VKAQSIHVGSQLSLNLITVSSSVRSSPFLKSFKLNSKTLLSPDLPSDAVPAPPVQAFIVYIVSFYTGKYCCIFC